MSYNGSGTFQINTSGQPVVAGTVISSTAFNALTADLATGLSTAITKDGQTTTTARIPFAAGINSTLVTDSTNSTSGSIITAGGVGIAKALYVGTTLNVTGASTMTGAIAVDSVTDSTSTTTGSIQTDGGVGIAKALFVGTTANIAGVTTVQAGTAALPAITTTGDTNTGLFFPAADTIAFSEGGVESMRIDSAGNVGIGTSTLTSGVRLFASNGTSGVPATTGTTQASGALRIRSGSNAICDFGVGAGSGTTTWIQAADQTGLNTNYDIAIQPNGGSVGIGTASPAYPLTLGNNKRFGSINTAGAGVNFAILDGSNNLTFGDDSTNTGSLTIQSRAETKFVLNTAERMRITSGGDFLLGTTSAFNSGKQCLAFSGATHQGFNIKNNADNPSDIYVGFYNAFGANTGAIRSGGSTTSYVTSSDYRLKENVQPLVNALDKVMALNPVSYTWKTGGEDNGFIAHELQLILPNAVSGEKDAVNEDGTINPQGVDYGRLTPILTAALQEAIAEIQSLKTRVAKLEAK